MKSKKWLRWSTLAALMGALLLAPLGAFANSPEVWTEHAIAHLAEVNKVEPDRVKITTEWTVVPNDIAGLQQTDAEALEQQKADLAQMKQDLRAAELEVTRLQNEISSVEAAAISAESKSKLLDEYTKQLEAAQKTVEGLTEDIAAAEEAIANYVAPEYPEQVAYALATVKYPGFSLGKLVVVDPETKAVIPSEVADTYPTVREIKSQAMDAKELSEYTIDNPMMALYLAVFVILLYLLLFRGERHSRKFHSALQSRGGVHSSHFSA